MQTLTSINRITDDRASLLYWHALDVDFVLAELEVEATVLFESMLQFSEYEQAVLELAVNVSVIRKREGAGTLVPRHHPTPERVNGCAEADHLEWVALLPSRATRDVVHLPLVIDIPKCAGI